jgi:hypothetical protein
MDQDEDNDGNEPEEVVLPEGDLDPAVLSTLPPSMQVWADWTTCLHMSCKGHVMCVCTSFMSKITSSVAQLDLMAKIRDNKIYENRARFQKHSAQPLNFSSFQIQEYLKASAFRCVFFVAPVASRGAKSCIHDFEAFPACDGDLCKPLRAKDRHMQAADRGPEGCTEC